MRPEGLPDAAADPVPYHRLSQLTAGHHQQPRGGIVFLANPKREPSPLSPDALLERSIDVPSEAQAVSPSEALIQPAPILNHKKSISALAGGCNWPGTSRTAKLNSR